MRCLNCSEKTRQATCGLCSCCAPFLFVISDGLDDWMTPDFHHALIIRVAKGNDALPDEVHAKLKAAIFPRHSPLRGLLPRPVTAASRKPFHFVTDSGRAV
jgi:hypothetical protein